MRSVFSFILIIAFFVGKSSAQETNQVTVKAGTIVHMNPVRSIKAADVEEGQTIDFRVIQDVKVDNICVIPSGTIAKGRVLQAKKSSIAGTKGKLAVSVDYLYLPGGEMVPFINSDIWVSGKNRTPQVIIASLFIWPCIFISGTKAVLHSNYWIQATVASNVVVSL